MTEEELEKEAVEKYNERLKQNGYKVEYRNETYIDGYLDSAEPREKRITELEAQIEKMKCCGNCKHCGEVRTYKGLDGKNIVVNCNSGRNYFCDKWEIK